MTGWPDVFAIKNRLGYCLAHRMKIDAVEVMMTHDFMDSHMLTGTTLMMWDEHRYLVGKIKNGLQIDDQEVMGIMK
jgi:hypothetical protein